MCICTHAVLSNFTYNFSYTKPFLDTCGNSWTMAVFLMCAFMHSNKQTKNTLTHSSRSHPLQFVFYLTFPSIIVHLTQTYSHFNSLLHILALTLRSLRSGVFNVGEPDLRSKSMKFGFYPCSKQFICSTFVCWSVYL